MGDISRQMKSVARRILRPTRKLPTRPSYPIVSLTRWRSGQGHPNFGDDLSHTIVTLLLARHGMTLEDEAARESELLAIGSIIHLAKTGAVIWGSGVNGKVPEHFHQYRSLELRAVRGPYTREWLKQKRGLEAPEIYGDPALLLPRLAGDRFSVAPGEGTIFVPNLNDILSGEVFDLPKGMEMLSPMQSWHRVIDAITQARFVAASSLHGIILAEAFGIPARYVRLTETENLFKFRDYYAGTGRDSFEFGKSPAEALEMGGEQSAVIAADALEAAFPFDLWIK